MANRTWIGTGAAPNDWTHPDNWSPTGVPTGGMHVYFEDSSVDCNTVSELNQSGVDLGSLNIDQSYTGSLGAAGTPLQSQTPILNIGYHNGPGTPSGSPLINIDLGNDDTAITVSNTGTSVDASKAPVRLKGSGSNTLVVSKGKVSFGTDTDDTTSVLTTLTVTYDTKVSTDADVFIGSGVALTTANLFGGGTVYECDCSATTIYAGTLLTAGVWAGATTLAAYGGTATVNSTGTITTCSIYGGTVDFTKTVGAKTITNMFLAKGGILKFNSTGTTLSGGILSLDVGQNTTYTAS